MNAISRPATPEETERAASVVIPQAELDRLFMEAQARRAREARRAKLKAAGRVSTIAALSVACVAEAVALAALAPTVRVEPVFVYLRDDGTQVSSRNWQDMPDAVRAANVVNVLSEYVRLREGYSSGEAGRAWNVVSALSAKTVREQFQQWYHRDNKESPQRVHGEKASVVVDVTDVQKDEDRPGAYRVYFNRSVRTADSLGRPEAMVASLRVRDVLNPKALPPWQRVQFNGPAIAVWEYPGAVHTTPLGAAAR